MARVFMNERQLGRLLGRIVLLTAPLSAALLATACGGTMTGDPEGGAGEHAMAGSSSGGGETGGTDSGGTGSGGTGTSGEACRGASMGCSPYMLTVPRACIPTNDASPGSLLPLETCRDLCGAGVYNDCVVDSVSAVSVVVDCPTRCVAGRRPPGFCPSAFFETHALGRYFAQMSELEAASVDAFRILRAELRAHGAPKRLLRAAGRAARDEVRHARATRALARRCGTESAPPARVRVPERSLEAIARENAVEGCVRETFGALLATWQATTASDPVVRAAMLRIARDETRHAALSWQVQRWLDTRLDPVARARVAAARHEAARELLQGVRTEPTLSFAARIGLPDSARAQTLASELRSQLWS